LKPAMIGVLTNIRDEELAEEVRFDHLTGAGSIALIAATVAAGLTGLAEPSHPGWRRNLRESRSLRLRKNHAKHTVGSDPTSSTGLLYALGGLETCALAPVHNKEAMGWPAALAEESKDFSVKAAVSDHEDVQGIRPAESLAGCARCSDGQTSSSSSPTGTERAG
jgi:hypothetical protein